MNGKQLEILNRLVKGDTVTDVSRDLNVSRTYIYNLMKTDEFKEVREKLEKDMYDSLFHIGVSELSEILINGKNHEKIEVFRLVTKLQNRVTDKSDVTISVESILQDLM